LKVHSGSRRNNASVKRIGGRWGVLECLCKTLYDTSLDLPSSIRSDLEVARLMIEAGAGRVRDAEVLLDWVESKLREKAVFLDNLSYWEGLLGKAKKGELTKREFKEAPFMETLLEEHEFLSHCLPAMGIELDERTMTLTEQKPLEEIRALLGLCEKLVVLGCGLCATATKTGGEEQVERIAGKLRSERVILRSTVMESPCDTAVAKRDPGNLRRTIAEADAIVALCCDKGVQTLGDLTRKTVVPALNTLVQS